MHRRVFIRGGAAALTAVLSGCGGAEADENIVRDTETSALPDTPQNDVVTPSREVAATTEPAPVAYTFQQEFTDPSAPLLKSAGGVFYPYYAYFGGDAQSDGPNGHRWLNDELQVYTSPDYTPAPFNPFSVSNGVLSISGRPTPPEFVKSPKPYVSGCLESSKGSFWDLPEVRATRAGHEQKYGYWEMRCRIPRSKGVWAAFWLTGGRTSREDTGFGEIDVFETIGEPNKIHQTVHHWWDKSIPGEGYAWNAPFDYAADFHTYAVLWTPDSIVWFVDGVETRRASSVMAARYRDRCGPMHMVVNIALGGSWPGSPDASTQFPAVMQIDYIRVRAL